MQANLAKLTTAVLLGFVLIGASACGGGGGDGAKVADLEKKVADLEKAAEAVAVEVADEPAEEPEETAEKKADDAAALKKAQEEAAAAKKRADAAETARKAAEAAKKKAEEQRQAAEDRLSQSDEERQFAGFGTSAGTLSVTPRNGVAAIIKTPDIGVGDVGTAVAPWAVTTGSSSDGSDTVTIYSDVGPNVDVAFRVSKYNAGNRVVDGQNEFVAGYRISGARTDVSRGGGAGFPDVSGKPKPFTLDDQGFDTQAQLDAEKAKCDEGDAACTSALDSIGTRDKSEHPKRYSVDVTGETLGGAAGTFRCEASSANADCTVQNRGGDQLFFVGQWTFRPAVESGKVTAMVSVPDEHFMWFGVWARKNTATTEWSYAVGHGPAGSRVSSVSAVSGTATYNGNAIGRFAIDRELGDDEAGAFAATASLTADFDANTLSGELTAFELTGENVPANNDWKVHLRKGSISGGSAKGTSAWSIDTDTDEGGSWAASFYSDLPANQRGGVVPHGVAGTFTAEHSGIAKMTGAFGAQ